MKLSSQIKPISYLKATPLRSYAHLATNQNP